VIILEKNALEDEEGDLPISMVDTTDSTTTTRAHQTLSSILVVVENLSIEVVRLWTIDDVQQSDTTESDSILKLVDVNVNIV